MIRLRLDKRSTSNKSKNLKVLHYLSKKIETAKKEIRFDTDINNPIKKHENIIKHFFRYIDMQGDKEIQGERKKEREQKRRFEKKKKRLILFLSRFHALHFRQGHKVSTNVKITGSRLYSISFQNLLVDSFFFILCFFFTYIWSYFIYLSFTMNR